MARAMRDEWGSESRSGEKRLLRRSKWREDRTRCMPDMRSRRSWRSGWPYDGDANEEAISGRVLVEIESDV